MPTDAYGLKLSAKLLEACGKDIAYDDDEYRVSLPEPERPWLNNWYRMPNYLDGADSRLGQVVGLVREAMPEQPFSILMEEDGFDVYSWPTEEDQDEDTGKMTGGYGNTLEEAIIYAAIRAAGLTPPEREETP